MAALVDQLTNMNFGRWWLKRASYDKNRRAGFEACSRASTISHRQREDSIRTAPRHFTIFLYTYNFCRFPSRKPCPRSNIPRLGPSQYYTHVRRLSETCRNQISVGRRQEHGDETASGNSWEYIPAVRRRLQATQLLALALVI